MLLEERKSEIGTAAMVTHQAVRFLDLQPTIPSQGGRDANGFGDELRDRQGINGGEEDSQAEER